MANLIKLKRSAVPGKAPATTDLQLGELAVNTYDGKLYLKKNDGADSIVQIGPATFLRPSVRTVTGNTTATTSDHTIRCDATSGALTVALPAASAVSGIMYLIKKIDTSENKVTVDADGSQTIEGNLTVELLSQFDFVYLLCDGSQWFKIASKTTSSYVPSLNFSDARNSMYNSLWG